VAAASSFLQVRDSVCAAKKSLEADRLQNFVYDEMRGMDSDKPADELRSAPEYVPIPEYTLDRRTRRGKVVLGRFCSGTMP
jgi:hypothetical protein